MTEKAILNLIEKDEWMMNILRVAEKLNFPDWVIGAGFVRNKVWDYLHGYTKKEVETNDIDLVYYDLKGNDQKTDEELSKRLRRETGIKWEIVNEAYAHKWNNLPPYQYGIDDLINLIVRPSPKFLDGLERVKERAKEKRWLEKWPKLKFNQ